MAGADALLIVDSALMILLLLLLVICGSTDVLYHKIYNVVTLPAIGLGLVLNLSIALLVDPRFGLQCFASSLSGLALGFFLFLLLFLFGGMGGGDVKFIAAIGALDPLHFGYQWILQVVFFSILAGGAIALVVMTMHGRLLRSFRNVFRTLFTFVTPGLQHEPLKREDSITMPFGLGISLGTLWTLALFMAGALP